MPGRNKRIGLCKLTGECGRFVKAHIIPEALSRREAPDQPLIQSGRGGRPKRRWTSWYDLKLVTAAGEKILSGYDDWAIKALREARLVWSGWGQMTALPMSEYDRLPGTDWGIREPRIDGKRLRLFFLSLLWRAAMSELPEFDEIQSADEDLKALTQMVLRGESDPISFFPIQLIQLSTMGFVHNLSPISATKEIPGFQDYAGETVPIFRFYFDGLIAHIDRRSLSEDYVEKLGRLVVGNEEGFVVSTLPFEISFQFRNMAAIMLDALRNWPASKKI